MHLSSLLKSKLWCCMPCNFFTLFLFLKTIEPDKCFLTRKMSGKRVTSNDPLMRNLQEYKHNVVGRKCHVFIWGQWELMRLKWYSKELISVKGCRNILHENHCVICRFIFISLTCSCIFYGCQTALRMLIAWIQYLII